MDSTLANCSVTIELPSNERSWYVYILASLAIYVSGFICILIGRIFWKVIKKWQFKLPEDEKDSRKPMEEYKAWYLQLKEFAVNLDTGKSVLGKCLVVTSFVLNMAAFISYLFISYEFPIEYCDKHDFAHGIHTQIWLLELCLYSFFAFHFLLRFIIATDKLAFWGLNIYTLVDILTIPIVIIQALQQKAWLGLRFLRVVYIRKLPDILIYLNLIETGKFIEIGTVVVNFMTVVLSSTGMIHLVENTGDFWAPHNYSNSNPLNYFECLYFMIVTFSTVGYGDYSCKTIMGRIFCMIFIICGLGVFASSIPAIFGFISSYTKYDRKFKSTPGKKHVIVTGHITDESVSSFIQDFLHPDRQCESNVTVVFLAPNYPSILIEGIIQKHPSSVFFFNGTVYNLKDCHRVKMSEADAVIVLCDKKSHNPEAEDAANITRVVSMKKYFSKFHIRCIVQLMRRDNKALLENTTHWRKGEGDTIVCIDELKYGFMAQCCYSPGFSTLLANLFVMRSSEKNKGKKSNTWREEYVHGVSCEIYSTTLSDYFENMSFPKAAAICFSELGLLLIAVEDRIGSEMVFVVNPSDDVIIRKETRAFLIAQDSKSVKKARRYCGRCHRDIVNQKKKLPVCLCKKSSGEVYTSMRRESAFPSTYIQLMEQKPRPSFSIDNMSRSTIYCSSAVDRFHASLKKLKYEIPKDHNLYDITGTYFWCPERPFDEAIMSLEEAAKEDFMEHVVVAVIADEKSPPLGIRELIQPLRASNQQPKDLKKIIILVADKSFLMKEWASISTFPGVFIVQGSPYRQVDLRVVNVHLADLVIILSPPNIAQEALEGVEKPAMLDKEVIMVTMNLRAMTFEQYRLGDTPNIKRQKHEEALPSLMKNDATNLNRTRHERRSMSTNLEYRIRRKNNEQIRMITELVYDSNTLYMEECEEDDEEFESEGIWMTKSYACGSVFTDSVLDFLASATYFNPDILTLVRNLVTGSVTGSSDLDIILSQGRQPEGTEATEEINQARKRCRVEQLALNDESFKIFGEVKRFGELFMRALSYHGTLCLGLYRLHNQERRSKSLNKRYVINFPPPDFLLKKDDLVYVLLQFEEKGYNLQTLSEEDDKYGGEEKINLEFNSNDQTQL